MKVTERDIDIVTRTIYGEARGETATGKLAVAWVIVNRANKHNYSLAEVVLKSVHFTTWNNARSNDINQLAMMTASDADEVFAKCKVAAFGAVFNLQSDPTMGATHYFANYVDPIPNWAEGKTFLSIGRHKFFNNID